MRVFLYRCDNCGVASFKLQDKGSIYLDMCGGCSRLLGVMYHHKITIEKILFDKPEGKDPRLFKDMYGYIFDCEGLKDDSNREGGNEHTSNVDRP